ncbi:MAG: patatin-like phospholipase family protein [Pseudomonadota bacterium]
MVKSIDVALQGGGSHGAFTWGVLDRLLDEPGFKITGVSGTSAGAMNAVALAQGLVEEGPAKAKTLLCTYWEKVTASAAFSPLQRTPFDRFFSGWNLDHSPMYKMLDTWSQFFSPYDVIDFGSHPLKEIVESTFSFDAINKSKKIKVFQSATNVKTGRLTIFRQPSLSVETTLASACLPTLYRAVEIADQAYWDGGYMGNPPIIPLIRETDTRDTVIVQINPFRREEIPKSSSEINNRLNEITFNSSLVREIEGLGFLKALVTDQDLPLDEFRNGRLHRIAADEQMRELSASSKMNASPDFVKYLFDLGRHTCEQWLEENGDRVGRETTWLPKAED